MQSAYTTNLTCTGIAVYMFRHFMGATSSGSLQGDWLKQCFRNGPLYGSTVTQQPTYENISINIFNQWCPEFRFETCCLTYLLHTAQSFL